MQAIGDVHQTTLSQVLLFCVLVHYYADTWQPLQGTIFEPLVARCPPELTWLTLAVELGPSRAVENGMILQPKPSMIHPDASI